MAWEYAYNRTIRAFIAWFGRGKVILRVERFFASIRATACGGTYRHSASEVNTCAKL